MSPRFVLVTLFGLLAGGAVSPDASRLPTPVEGAIEQVTVAELRRSITVLASDEMAGRGLGHAGNRQAEQYIANAFRDAKVPPAAANYFQPVEVYQPVLGTDGHLTITSAGRPPLANLAIGSDFYPLPRSGDRAATGRLIFAGYGISAPALRHDDYAGLNARGAIVLVLDDAPDELRRWPSISSADKIDIATLDRKVTDAQSHGAAGLIVIRPYPGDPRVAWPERPSVRSSSYRLFAPMRASPLPVATIVDRANDTIRLTIKEDYDRDAQGLLHRSDNWPFLQHGIPAVFLTTGLHPDYHTPDDDTQRIDFAKLERITELASRAVWMTADGDAPRFKAQ